MKHAGSWIIALALWGCSDEPNTPVTQQPADLEEWATNQIRDSLADPEAAQFRNLKVVRIENGEVPGFLGAWVVCGEVNGKNLFGGYVGYRPFHVHRYDTGDSYYWARDAHLEDNRIFDAQFSALCEEGDARELSRVTEEVAREDLEVARRELEHSKERLREARGE